MFGATRFVCCFDMVDHKILLNQLESDFGITGMALRRIELYLRNQSQGVVMEIRTQQVPSQRASD